MAKEKQKGNTAERVRKLAEPLAEELGLTIWDVTFQKEGADWFLRIYIDRDSGVSIDDCVDMTHAVNPVLDAEDPVAGEYTLEVSSPGINRRLTKYEHFEKLINAPLRVRLFRPLEDGTRELEGVLVSAGEDGSFELLLDDETVGGFEKKECASVVLLEE